MATTSSHPCESTLPPEDTVFSRYVLALFSTAMVHLGRIPDPDSGKPVVNVPLARESVQYLQVLQRKTANNLTEDEARVLADVLARAEACLQKACELLGA